MAFASDKEFLDVLEQRKQNGKTSGRRVKLRTEVFLRLEQKR